MRRALSASLLALLLCTAATNAEIIRLTVVHTNDIHGGIDPSEATFMSRDFPPKLGGGPSMISFLQDARREVESRGGRFLLLDAGDIFQGTPVGTVTKGRAVIDFMNLAGYDALALGNHDFDEGTTDLECLPERLKGRRYYEPRDVGRERDIARIVIRAVYELDRRTLRLHRRDAMRGGTAADEDA